MRKILGALVAIALGAGPALAGEKIQTDEGWYRIEDGSGEAPDSAVILVQAEESVPPEQPPARPAPRQGQTRPPPPGTADPRRPTLPQEQPAPGAEQPMTLAEEIAEFQRPDCDAVRGQYLQRVLELHGVDDFSHIPPEQLAALTRVPPPVMGLGVLGFPLSVTGDPALALLYGFPPVPPGSLSHDFTLKNLARDLIRCMNMAHGSGSAPSPSGQPPASRAPAL